MTTKLGRSLMTNEGGKSLPEIDLSHFLEQEQKLRKLIETPEAWTGKKGGSRLSSAVSHIIDEAGPSGLALNKKTLERFRRLIVSTISAEDPKVYEEHIHKMRSVVEENSNDVLEIMARLSSLSSRSQQHIRDLD